MVVPSGFITGYMPEASGDYVKVYLYLLQNGCADIEKTAEALRLTEGDVKRAIGYWEDKGVIVHSIEMNMEGQAAEKKNKKKNDDLRDSYRSTEGTEKLLRLSEDPEFAELMFIVQKYRSKIADEKETEVFAFLYDGLHLKSEVIEYLVEYAVEHEHNSIRYIETLGKDWAEIGISDVESAKRRVKQFEEGGKKETKRKTPSRTRAKLGESNDPHTDYDEIVINEMFRNMG